MAAMAPVLAMAILFAGFAFGATECACEPVHPESMKSRQCSLCNEAEKQPPEAAVFFLKDINPRKPGRWLALPKAHGSGLHHLHDLPAEVRTRLWSEAIRKGRELFGEEWGLAYNGEMVRTQCHTHIHTKQRSCDRAVREL
jgi:diadenosine tetraphosphate (Ap4A) HIT family hydrolase